MMDWRSVAADDDCERAACPYYLEGKHGDTECFVYAGIQRFTNAQIVVANHTLTLIDAQLAAGTLLGPYSVLVVDEAHSFAEKAQDTWGTTLKPRTVSATIQLINKMLERQGINYFEVGFARTYRNLEDEIFAPFNSILGQSVALKKVPSSIVEASKFAASKLAVALGRVSKDLNEYVNLFDENHPRTLVVKAAKERLSKLVGDLKAVYGEGIGDDYKDNWLVFFETGYSHKHVPYGILKLRPINVAPLMRSRIFDAIPTTVFMSATMRLGTSFAFMRKELGVPKETQEFVGTSPFNYEKNVVGYFPKHLPEVRDKDYLPALVDEIKSVLEYSNGRALVLFTNNSHMKHCYEAIYRECKYKCYMQGQGAKSTLVELFKNDTHSCLFATRSFFTGIDIPGESLSCVSLTRAPFQVPTDPMFAAKADLIESDGGSSFNDLSLPLMLFDVRQSFGRLIRTVTDKGLFAFLDSRAMNKSYGQRIINSLPNIQILDSLDGKPRARPAPKHYEERPSSLASIKKTISLEED
jgi:ATP-dependent DNA helicase DinG